MNFRYNSQIDKSQKAKQKFESVSVQKQFEKTLNIMNFGEKSINMSNFGYLKNIITCKHKKLWYYHIWNWNIFGGTQRKI